MSYVTFKGQIALQIESFIADESGELNLVDSRLIESGLADPGAFIFSDSAVYKADLSSNNIRIRMDINIGGNLEIYESLLTVTSEGNLSAVGIGFTNPVDQTLREVSGNFTGLGTETVVGFKDLDFTANLLQTQEELADLSQNAFSLSNQSSALAALDGLKSQLNFLSEVQSQIGAGQSRIAVAVNVLSVSREQNIAASSRITDADIGKETSELVRKSILQEAGAAVLAQANQSGRISLLLLSNS